MKVVTLLIAASFVGVALPAHAGVCTKEIEMVTQLLSGGGAAAPSVSSVAPAAPSTSALSSATGGGAAAGALGSGVPEASPEALESVEEAKMADAAGDEASCMEYIGKAKELLGLVQ
jgi:hypothetical protein